MAVAQVALSDTQLGQSVWMWGGIQSAQPLFYSDEMWRFTPSSGTWTLFDIVGRPTRSVGPAMCAVGNTLYLFGGQEQDTGILQNTLYTFSTQLETWGLPGTLGTTPAARAYHTMACANDRAYLLGGSGASSSILSDFHYFDTLSATWVAVTAAGGPSARKGHSLTHSGERLYVFGGGASGGSKLNDAYSFDLGSSVWRALQMSGDRPAAREGHAAVVIDDRLYIYGGQDRYGYLNDVHALSLASFRWSQPRAAGFTPTPRWGMLSALSNQALYVYGGISQTSVGAQELNQDLWVMTTHCSGLTVLTTPRATFASGDSYYPAYSNCSWLITPPAANRQVRRSDQTRARAASVRIGHFFCAPPF